MRKKLYCFSAAREFAGGGQAHAQSRVAAVHQDRQAGHTL